MNDLFDTLAQAKDKVEVDRDLPEGTMCPCCNQFTKRYKRKLNKSMARQLIWLCFKTDANNNYIYFVQEAPRQFVRAVQLGTLAHWGMVEQKPHQDPDKKTSGYWRPTNKGREFAKGHITVPSHVYIFANKAEKFTDKYIDISWSLGKPFHYQQMMNEFIERGKI